MNSRLCALLLSCALPFAASATAPAAAPDAVPAAVPAAPVVDAKPRGTTVPAGVDEGPVTIGPLPVVPDPPPRAAPDASAASTFAADDDPTTGTARAPAGFPGAEDEEEAGSLVGTLFRTLLVLGMVIGLVYVTLNFGLRKLMGVRAPALAGGAGRGLVHVIQRVPLDPKRSLFVIQAAGEYLLVGGAEDGLNLISRLDTEEVARLLSEQKRDTASASPFLSKLLARKNPPPPPAGA